VFFTKSFLRCPGKRPESRLVWLREVLFSHIGLLAPSCLLHQPLRFLPRSSLLLRQLNTFSLDLLEIKSNKFQTQSNMMLRVERDTEENRGRINNMGDLGGSHQK
jgi:hypothetical protein